MIITVPGILSIQNILGTIFILIILSSIRRIANRVQLVYSKSNEGWTTDIPQEPREGSFSRGVLLQPLENLSQPTGFMIDGMAAEGPEVKTSSEWSWFCNKINNNNKTLLISSNSSQRWSVWDCSYWSLNQICNYKCPES